jgi:Domain of unknown function (DUF4349)
MKHMTKYFGLLFLITLLGCAKNPESASMKMADEEIVTPTAGQESDEVVERKLIKEGQVEFETDNLSSTRKNIFEAVTKYKGYVSSDQEFKSPGRKSNTVIIRVPAENFDNLLKDATLGVEKFDSKEINVKDVTEVFLDVQARLKTKKELESRYLDLLKKAKNVIEILEIEKQIGQLRSEIESIEGRLKYLQNQVSFSTLTMTFYEDLPNQTQYGQKFKNGFINGWDNLILFFVLLINIWPFILIGLGLVVGIRIYRRKK